MFNTVINWSVAGILASFTIMPISLNRQSAPAVGPNKEETALKGCAANFDDDDRITFHYTKDVYDEESVTSVENWEIGLPSEPECDGTPNIPCTIAVLEQYVTGSDELDPSINLSALHSSGGRYYIDGSADTNMEINNKSF